MRIETRAVHAGRRTDSATGAVTPPIYLSTTFERGADGEYPLGFGYSREENPNRAMLEQCLASVEEGSEALVFSSGQAVTTALAMGLEPGDHILAPDDVYYCWKKIFAEMLPKWDFAVDYVDMTDIGAVQAAMRPNTRLVWIETPSNPLLKITDLQAVADIARKANAVSVCDSTFATPVLQHPFRHGIDMVVHSTTKYIGGHSDVVGGVLITKHPNYLFERARKAQRFGGMVPSPFDCWLTLRGVSTLPWRVRAHCQNAMAVARFLAGHAKVEVVHYPGIESHPQHAVARRQMDGYGGMMSFQVRGCRDTAMGVAARVGVFTRATSLGGPHSFIEHRASIEGPKTRTPPNLLRMSIGLEHPDDLIDDLGLALSGI
jgi:cystathionine gamma-synthase